MTGAPRSTQRTAVLAALGAAAVDAGAFAVFWRVHEVRRALLSSLVGEVDEVPFHDFDVLEVEARARSVGGGKLAFHAFAALEVEARTLLFGGAMLAVLALATILFGIFRARRRETLSTLAIAAPTAILGIAGLGTLLGARAYLSHYVHLPCFGFEAAEHDRYDTLAGHAAFYQTGRLAIFAVAILSTLAVLSVVRRAPASPEPSLRLRSLLAPATLFALGIAAFTLTRAQATDFRNPMPFVPGSGRLWLSVAQLTALPPAYLCEDMVEAPIVVLEARGIVVDGAEVPDRAELIKVLTGRRELWHLVQPNVPFPGVVGVAIPAGAKLDAVRPLLATLRAAGYPIVEALEVREKTTWKSRTLGEVTSPPRSCAVRIEADRDLPPADTWGEMTQALVSGLQPHQTTP